MLTLWDLVKTALGPHPARERPALAAAPAAPAPVRAEAAPSAGMPPEAAPRARVAPPAGPGAQPGLAAPAHPGAPARPRPCNADHDPPAVGAQERYEQVTRLMLERYGVRVRKWRRHMSGIAWYVRYRDGTVKRLIEAPRPRGPMSVAVFLHEIGHHAIGFSTYKPRCLEEYHAWAWALAQMEELGLNVTDAVRHRMHRSLWYAVEKARRRGIREIPDELRPYLEKPARQRRRPTSRAA